MSLDGIALYPQIKYLNSLLLGGRIDKICQPNRYDLFCYVRQPGITYVLYISVDPQRPLITITGENPDNPPEPSSFCMLLRKQIEGGRIAEVEQYGLDRILTIDIDTIGAKGVLVTKTLVIELVGKYSNVILLQDGRIVDSLRRVGENSNRVRAVLPGYEYNLPPMQNGIDFINSSRQEIINKLSENGESDLYRGLMASLQGCGPVTVRQIIAGAGLNQDELIGDLTDAEKQSLADSCTALASDLKNNRLVPTMITDRKKKIKAVAPFEITTFNPEKESFVKRQDYNELLEEYRAAVNVVKLPNQAIYAKLMKNEANRLKKKIKVLGQELAQADKAESYRIKADTLMTYQYEIKDEYAKQVELPNIYSEKGEKIAIALDNRYSLMDNVQIYYKKYEKLKRSKEMIQEQINIAKHDLSYAESIENAIEQCQSISDLEGIKEEMIKAHFLPKPKRKQMAMAKSKPWRFTLPNGMELLVGKNNIQNDYISFKMAHNEDIWLHTKDIPGSHVVIITKGEEVDDYNLGLAAQIAIYFSKGRDSTNVQVDYLKRKYLKKPAGAKPGYTIFTNNRTIYATVDEEQIYPIIKK